ncbi:AraC family transcriptional regulator [soil metagenome]
MNADLRQSTITLLSRLAPHEGYTLTALPDVRLLRSNRPLARTPVMYEPGIVIVCQGRKRGLLGDTVYRYDANRYLVVSLPVPFAMETDASASKPLLAIYIQLDVALTTALMREVGMPARGSLEPPAAMTSSPMERPLATAVLRLLETLSDPDDARVLAVQYLREVYYRVLTGAQGAVLEATVARSGHFARIAKALERIHRRYAEPLSVAALADEAAMSTASFHAHFKHLTASTPMQYLKLTRLHQARILMLREHVNASTAASKVGYESQSQFNREFKRTFGLPPLREVKRLRAAYALPAAEEPSRYVSSH